MLLNRLPAAALHYQAIAHHWRFKFDVNPRSDPTIDAFLRGLDNFKLLLHPRQEPRRELPVAAILRFYADPPPGTSDDQRILVSAALAYGMRGIQRGSQIADLECRDIAAVPIVVNGVSELGVRATIRTSKTDQSGARPQHIVIDRGVSPIDPVRLLDAYMQMRFGVSLSAWNSSPLASSTARFFTSGGRPISTASLRNWVQMVARHSRLAGRFGSHSLRIAGACWAAAGGLSLETIMAIAGWKSDSSAVLYLRAYIATLQGASRCMGF